MTIDSLPKLEKRLEDMYKAQEEFSTFSQEKVDEIFKLAAKAAYDAREELAKLAVEETGMGVVEHKIIKNTFGSEVVYNAYKDLKTCGVIEEDRELGMTKIAEPLGVIAAVIPTTNPTSTAVFKALLALKTRNAIIISPHPRAKKCTVEAARIVLDAAVKAGAPEGIIGWVDEPTLEFTNYLMQECDAILATGGPGMVHSAYSSGKPALGVGPGNTPVIIDESADLKLAVDSIIESKTFDNGVICASEQSVTAIDSVYDEVRDGFEKNGCYILSEDEKEKVRNTILINGALNANIVGQSAFKIAKMADVVVPEDTKILIGEVTSTDVSEAFAHEKLSPVLALYKADSFETAVKMADTLVRQGGYGHTSSLYINLDESEKLNLFNTTMKTGRILINSPSSQGAIGGMYNHLDPSLTLGCGSWGNNSTSENVSAKHLLNTKIVALRQNL